MLSSESGLPDFLRIALPFTVTLELTPETKSD